ncbi:MULTISPECIES: hypothetical protein [unclassified Sinorhizobium]|uniref:hypothetical protein n=1 Tax=unclassified Sinorhizobium TaxID=2613772 RepID=UPI0035239874
MKLRMYPKVIVLYFQGTRRGRDPQGCFSTVAEENVWHDDIFSRFAACGNQKA